MATSQAGVGLGTVLSISPSTGTAAYVVVGELKTFSQSGRQASVVDVTNFASTAKESLAVIVDEGTWEFSGSRVGSDAGQALMETSFYALAKVLVKVQTPPRIGQVTTGDLFSFDGIIQELSYGISAEKEITITGKLKTTSIITVTLGA
jgi:hypothetical protein